MTNPPRVGWVSPADGKPAQAVSHGAGVGHVRVTPSRPGENQPRRKRRRR